MKVLLSDPRLTEGPHMNKAFLEACRACDVDTIRLFLNDHRVDPGVNDGEAFGLVIRAADDMRMSACPLIQLLLDDGRVDPSAHDNWAVCEAADRGFAEGIKLLLVDPRVNLMPRNNEPLLLACRNGDVDVVRVLVSDPRMNGGGRVEEIRRAVSWAMEDAHAEKKRVVRCDSSNA